MDVWVCFDKNIIQCSGKQDELAIWLDGVLLKLGDTGKIIESVYHSIREIVKFRDTV